MSKYVADTHALIWYFYDSPRLGAGARDAFAEIANSESMLVVPAVVVAEMLMVVEKGRVAVTPADLREIIQRLRKTPVCQFTSLTPDLVLNSATLTAIPDIFDRLIVCEARELDAAILTKDKIITDSNLARVIW